MPKDNDRKVLLNLPGGGFVMGVAGGTGMIESIPLAAMAGRSGLGHAFFYNIDLPESREAFDVMAQFFQQHLKLAK